ncbi:MTH1187 family thiamine-binding protein [Reinekea blandensis]|uniref:Thiamine-binding protein domain-containing protein n=1 Tax=Reinekea blandensis MED297 TaxID=314283 RepID=A4BJC1_9GAMM|nr:MTH1187 family thiamine-binding protein [Reinekea blandensis]EAR07779.1 hypothetical protein MED297_03230 [Reinekea sp. MED297] [Reinekea blandensis MED297]
MKCMADLCVIPFNGNISVADEIAQCHRVLQRFNLDIQLHGYGTNLYGEWDEVFAAIKACHTELHDQGIVRISSTIKVGTRTDKDQTIQDKVDAVDRRLGE